METDQVGESEQARGKPERDRQSSGNSVLNPENFKVAIELKVVGMVRTPSVVARRSLL